MLDGYIDTNMVGDVLDMMTKPLPMIMFWI
jgi:hypothetical protein